MGRELIDAFGRADLDDNIRAVIVTGAGRGFCAGADLSPDSMDEVTSGKGPAKEPEDVVISVWPSRAGFPRNLKS